MEHCSWLDSIDLKKTQVTFVFLERLQGPTGRHLGALRFGGTDPEWPDVTLKWCPVTGSYLVVSAAGELKTVIPAGNVRCVKVGA